MASSCTASKSNTEKTNKIQIQVMKMIHPSLHWKPALAQDQSADPGCKVPKTDRMPERRGPELLDHLPEPIQTHAAAPSWKNINSVPSHVHRNSRSQKQQILDKSGEETP
ncbi:hypothetical protein BaRGS_00009039 [Batillaria attramentaria]|uniref:Uncharacterized protein n=1 Tax=Batillaria attramentaria TaxID=370345 RepID=A0ABD0LKS2_9CAEN